ncbi:hypothetical protein [Proteus hauseri]|uniref:hypothetical protein n=1 Tax=Proteus hauseri TaxID=183417 RepID=UPI00100977B3|nr:hypothetical protein [Proteus hauseri]QAV22036.1 hypothetical protein PH4a_01160 [Proteus hauseri]
MGSKRIKVPKDLLEELANTYQGKIYYFMEWHKGFYEEVGSPGSRTYNEYVDNFNAVAALLDWDKMEKIK